MENWRPKKWLDSIEKQKRRRSNLKECDRRSDRHPNRQTDRVNVDNNRALIAVSQSISRVTTRNVSHVLIFDLRA